MASGKQYYKYKAKAELLENLLFDIKTLLMIDEADPKEKMHTLRCLYTKYERLENETL